MNEIENKINSEGRILLRKSGTEPVIRIMVEYEDKEKCIVFAEELEKVIIERGHLVE